MGAAVRIVNGKVVADPFPKSTDPNIAVVHSMEVIQPKSPYKTLASDHRYRGPTKRRRTTAKKRLPTSREGMRYKRPSATRRRSLVGRGTPVRKTPRKSNRVQRKSGRLTSKRNIVYGATKAKRRSLTDDLW